MNNKNITFVSILILLTSCVGISPELGVVNGKLTKCPTTPNCVNSMVIDDVCFIQPIITTDSKEEIKNNIIDIINEFDNTNIIKVEDNYIRVEFKSIFFKFVDDVEFYFPDTKLSEIIIHVRSASRIGQSDLGVNRRRIENIRSMYNKK